MSKAELDAEVGAPKRPPRPSRARWYILLGLLVPITARTYLAVSQAIPTGQHAREHATAKPRRPKEPGFPMKIATHNINGVNGRLPVLPEEHRRRRLRGPIRPRHAAKQYSSGADGASGRHASQKPAMPARQGQRLVEHGLEVRFADSIASWLGDSSCRIDHNYLLCCHRLIKEPNQLRKDLIGSPILTSPCRFAWQSR